MLPSKTSTPLWPPTEATEFMPRLIRASGTCPALRNCVAGHEREASFASSSSDAIAPAFLHPNYQKGTTILAILTRLWSALTTFADQIGQKILGCIGWDRRSRKVTAERLIVGRARLELALICRTDYATHVQAESAWRRYQQLYTQITLPEVRQALQPPNEWNIVPVGNSWRITDQATARNLKPTRNLSKAGRRNKRLADALPVRPVR